MEKGFEGMEHDNAKGHFATEQSKTTPESIARDNMGVYQMKNEAMDEAFGQAGKSHCQGDHKKIKAQFKDYNWA